MQIRNALTDDTRHKPKLKHNFYHTTFDYHSGSRLGQIYHAKIRLNCNSLRYHLFKKNIIDRFVCACGEVENASHFFSTVCEFRAILFVSSPFHHTVLI